jgi:hypothetical protein
MKNIKYFLLSLVYILVITKGQAQSIFAELNNSTLLNNDTCLLTYTSDVAINAPALKMPSGIKKVNTTTSYDSVKNKWLLVVKLQALRVGEYNMPVININNIKSNSARLSVIDIGGNNTNSSKIAKELDANEEEPLQKNTLSTYAGNDVFGRCDFVNKTYIKGEQINVEFNAYSKYTATINDFQPPPFSNCWVQKIREIDLLAEPQQVTIKGQTYLKYTLASYGIFSLNELPILMNQATAIVETSVGTNTVDNSTQLSARLGLEALEKKTFRLDFANSEIKIIPLQNTVCSTPLVGNYTLTHKIQKQSNGSVQVLYTLQGSGNLKFCSDLNLPFTDAWAVDYKAIYDTSWMSNNLLCHKRTMNYTLIPKRVGNLRLSDSSLFFISNNGYVCKQLKLADTIIAINQTPFQSKTSTAENKFTNSTIQFLKKNILQNRLLWAILFTLLALSFALSAFKKRKHKHVIAIQRQDAIQKIIENINAIDTTQMPAAQVVILVKQHYLQFMNNHYNLTNTDYTAIQALNIQPELKKQVLQFLEKTNDVLYGNAEDVAVEKIKALAVESIKALS